MVSKSDLHDVDGRSGGNALPELRRYTLRARLCASLGYFFSVRRGAARTATATQWLSRHGRGAGKHQLVTLTWDEAQVSGSGDPPAVTDEQIAQGGPYSVKEIQEHLLAGQDDGYVVEKRDDGTLSVLSVQ